MINLLPPAIKQEVAFARRNVILRNYIVLVISLGAITIAALMGGRYYTDQQTKQADARLADTKLQIASYSKLQSQAGAITSRLSSIQTIQKNQAKFSLLLSDLAQYMPRGTAITSITLTGDDKKPVRLSVSAVDYQTALGFRDSLTASKRISAADIESIKNDPSRPASSPYIVTVTFAFSPGEAK